MDKFVLRTVAYKIDRGHELYDYCDNMCFLSKNLYNVTNYMIRQFMSSVKKEPSHLTDNEKEVIELFSDYIDKVNEIRRNNGNPSLFVMPDEKNWFIPRFLLDGVLKLSKNIDYYALPAQTNQAVIKTNYDAWKSYFKALKSWKKNPSAFTGMPRIPRYEKKNGRKLCKMTNQVCKINGNLLRFPKTDLKLILDFMPADSSLREVRIVPLYDYYNIEVVYKVRKENRGTERKSESAERIVGIDLGVGNLAAITNNIGLAPVIIKGGIVKCHNQWYNKQSAYYKSILMQGHETDGKNLSTNRLYRLAEKRKNQIHDYFHKASRFIVNYCIENNIDTIVIGKNDGWKKENKFRKDTKQNFVQLPHNLLISMIKYKAEEEGISVIETEESYTSKSSFLDRDILPVYKEGEDVNYVFSGRRVSRGKYRTTKGITINADINGSANIIHKVFPNACKGMMDRGIVSMPSVVRF